MDDRNPRGVFEINPKDADEWNKKNFGIFWSVNEFDGPRQIKNLIRINSWAVDIDKGSKDDMMKIFNRFLVPSLVIETKRGFHVYWDAVDATKENFQAIVLDRLVFYFGADKNARDIARILRVPGYNHCKEEPYEVKAIYRSSARYTEAQMLRYFRLPKKAQDQSELKQELRKNLNPHGDDLWEKVYNLDCEQALLRLSGKGCVGSDVFTFRRVANGNLNILSNGKGTSCWIDLEKKIGSLDKGGPTVFQWLKWYGHSNKRVVEIMKDEFSELFV